MLLSKRKEGSIFCKVWVFFEGFWRGDYEEYRLVVVFVVGLGERGLIRDWLLLWGKDSLVIEYF